jgi:hypothetical protein
MLLGGYWEFNGHRVSVWGDEKIPEMDGGGGYITVRIISYHSTLYFKMVKMANFTFRMFYDHFLLAYLFVKRWGLTVLPRIPSNS